MPTRAGKIVQADFDALATLANSKLLPLVNAAIAAGTWPGIITGSWFPHLPYDKIVSPGVPANPQPAYSFNVATGGVINELNRIRGDFYTLIFGGTGIGGVGGTPLNAGLYLNQENIVSGPWCVGVIDAVTFPNSDLVVGYTLADGSTINGGIPIQSDGYFMNGVLMADVGMPAYNKVGFVFEDNEFPANFSGNCGRVLAPQEFYGNNIVGSGGGWSRSLTYVANVAGTWNCKIYFPFTGSGSIPPDASTFTKTMTPDYGWTWQTFGSAGSFILVGTLSAYALAAGTATIAISITPPAGYTFASSSPNGGTFFFISTVFSDFIFASGNNISDVPALSAVSIAKKLSLPDVPAASDFTIKFNDPGGGFTNPLMVSRARFQISQSIKGVWVANTLPVPGNNVFISQDMPPYVQTSVHNEIGDLVAISGTLPSLASAPFSGQVIDNLPTTQYDNTTAPTMDSMRQTELLYRREYIEIIGGFPVDAGPEYNRIQMACQAQPAQWLVKKDTDFVPFNYGFNPNDGEEVIANNTAANDGSLLTNSFSISSPITGIKIRLVGTGTGCNGWLNGPRYFGSALAETMTIYFSNSPGIFPNPASPATVAFSVNANAVDIFAYAPAGFLATVIANGGFNYAIAAGNAQGAYNPATVYKLNDIVTVTGANAGTYIYINAVPSSGNNPWIQDGHWMPSVAVNFDIVLEVDTGAAVRQYFPALKECFSYSMDGTPWISHSGNNSHVEKPIPQNGYSIFKVRATRLPVANAAGIGVTPGSGDLITVLLGQNRLQLDGTLVFAPFFSNEQMLGAGDTGTGAGDGTTGAGGSVTPFTIQIPANARDSGDVDIFKPVLGGNELVYQSSEPIILEAFGNWQPCWFSSGYGTSEPFPNFSATAFPNCLSFVNFYETYASNLSVLAAPVTHAEFPLSVEIYNDLMALLELI